MARLQSRLSHPPGSRVLVIDDDAVLLRTTVQLLLREGHDVVGESRPRRGIEIARTWRPSVILLDYFMPEMNGDDVVRAIRTFDPIVQILLVTGYAADRPARQMLRELAIQGYHDKTDGPHRLLVLLDAALQHHRVLAALERQRQTLRHILDVAERLHRLQPLDDLYRLALEHAFALIPAGQGSQPTERHGLFVSDGPSLSIRAGIGSYAEIECPTQLRPTTLAAIRLGLQADASVTWSGGYIVLPLVLRPRGRACLVLRGDYLPDDVLEPCRLYTRQVATAIEANVLYERATIDALTGLINRGMAEERLREELLLAGRRGGRTSVLAIDLDHFKRVNDTWGHAAGDEVLRAVAGVIRGACRASDVVGRWGGEELVVVLPDTGIDGAQVIGERVRAAVEGVVVHFEDQQIRVTTSVGIATVAGTTTPSELMARADAALYRAKASGRNRVCAHLELATPEGAARCSA